MNTPLSLLHVCFWSWAFKTVSLLLRFFNYIQCLDVEPEPCHISCLFNPSVPSCLLKQGTQAGCTGHKEHCAGVPASACALLTIRAVFVWVGAAQGPQQHCSSLLLPALLLCFCQLWWPFTPCRAGTHCHSWSPHLPDHILHVVLYEIIFTTIFC